MPFTKPAVHSAAAIGEIEYRFLDKDGEVGSVEASAHVAVTNEAGQRHWNVNVPNLVDHLTTQEKQALWAMMTRLRALAVERLLQP